MLEQNFQRDPIGATKAHQMQIMDNNEQQKAIEDQPYSFLYLDLQTNPATAYIRFETPIAEGEKKLFKLNI